MPNRTVEEAEKPPVICTAEEVALVFAVPNIVEGVHGHAALVIVGDEPSVTRLEQVTVPPEQVAEDVATFPAVAGNAPVHIARFPIVGTTEVAILLENILKFAPVMHPGTNAVATVQSIASAPPMANLLAVAVTPLVPETVPVATLVRVPLVAT